MAIHAAHWRDFVFDLLFPVECLDCGRAGEWLCGDCINELPLSEAQYCLNCKKHTPAGAFCPDCAPAYALDGVLIASDYDHPVIAALIKSLKYRQVRKIAKILGLFLAKFLSSLWLENQAEPGKNLPLFSLNSLLIAPIPLHTRRYRWRGFNQADLIARAFTAKTGTSMEENGLVRTGHRAPQAKLNEKQRKINLAGCFRWQGRPLHGENFLIIDDVVTTGSTLNEAAKALKNAGAGHVWGLVVAKG